VNGKPYIRLPNGEIVDFRRPLFGDAHLIPRPELIQRLIERSVQSPPAQDEPPAPAAEMGIDDGVDFPQWDDQNCLSGEETLPSWTD
jgi:hypothetical protein